MPLRAEGEGKGRSFLGVVGFSLMMVLKVVPDFRSTGIKGGKRAFEWCCIVRAVCTTDVMTATVAEIPHELMVHITDRITHEVAGINRVLYDFTPKPTGTVKFE